MHFWGAIAQTHRALQARAKVDPELHMALLRGHHHMTPQVILTLDAQGHLLPDGVATNDDAAIKWPTPVTEASAGRTGKKAAPHGLADALCQLSTQHCTPQWQDAAGVKHVYRHPANREATEFVVQSDPLPRAVQGRATYLSRLEAWRDRLPESAVERQALQSIRTYVAKDQLITDLLAAHLLYVQDGQLKITRAPDAKGQLPADTGHPTATLASHLPRTSHNALKLNIFFRVALPSGVLEPWTSDLLQASWNALLEEDADAPAAGQTGSQLGFCLLTGTQQPLRQNFPKNLLRTAANGKLMSQNDKIGFTYRGRFGDAHEYIAPVGTYACDDLANVLRHLVRAVGVSIGKYTVLVWTGHGRRVRGYDEDAAVELDPLSPQHASAVRDVVAGREVDLPAVSDKVFLAILAPATEGTLAVTHFGAYSQQDFASRLRAWQERLAWPLPSAAGERVCAPTRQALARFLTLDFTKETKATLLADHWQTLHRCMLEGQPVPRHIVAAAVSRVVRREGFSPKGPKSKPEFSFDDWDKYLAYTCALIRGATPQPERISMSLDQTVTSRSYLFGRLLALADRLELAAYRSKDREPRQTHAMQSFAQFAARPCSTWARIEERLIPYRAAVQRNWPGALAGIEGEIAEVMALFAPAEFGHDQALMPDWLLGFHCQRHKLAAEAQARKDAKAKKEAAEAVTESLM